MYILLRQSVNSNFSNSFTVVFTAINAITVKH